VADDAVAQFKLAQKQIWAAGDWDEISKLFAGAGAVLLERVAIEPGLLLLDVGTGSGGNVAIPAALLGARVVGADLTTELFEAARRRAADARVEVDWVEGDAESLPFADETFDRVLSTFGHMFAPHHALAGAELARVVKPGGIVGTTTWTPEGAIGAMLRTVDGHLPPPPDFAEPPILWGNEGHVREMLEPHGLRPEFAREVVRFESASAEEFMAYYERHFGPLVAAKGFLGDSWPDMRRDLVETFETWNTGTAGTFGMDGEYLVTIARRS
jgi:ubiquinone/menaquinone biosynthesis C-methylase UbiE